MDLVRLKYFESFSHMKTHPISPPTSASIFGSPLHSSSHHAGFPIIAVAIIGILSTGILLVSYYIFVIKCCLNWHRIDLLRRFSFSINQRVEDPLMVYLPAVENRGLDESVIRSIPVFRYKKREERDGGELGGYARIPCECAVCLNEFQENEKLRVIPNCAHIFHIDCIDVWLQSNANCPLCRNSISSATTGNTKLLFPLDPIIAPSSTPHQDPNLGNFRDEDYVVIEIANTNPIPTNHPSSVRTRTTQERLNSGEITAGHFSISPSPRKTDQQKVPSRKYKKFSHVTSMGDECINTSKKDDEFAAIQPIRRSFSMDSATDRQLYLAVQEIIIQQQRQVADVSPFESSSSRVKRSFFSFGHVRGSRNVVPPIHLEP